MWTSLIGFMGSGKSTVARRAAERALGTLVDLDRVIAERAGCPVGEVFARDGEAEFRKLELAALESLPPGGDILLACGGGIVVGEAARRRLRANGVVVWLDASWRRLHPRLLADGGRHRPLVTQLGEDSLLELFRRRRPLYARTADFRLPTAGESAEDLARQVLYCRRRFAGRSPR